MFKVSLYIHRYADGEEQPSTHFPTHERSEYHGWTTQLEFTSYPLAPADDGKQFKCCANIEDVCADIDIPCSTACEPDVYCKYQNLVVRSTLRHNVFVGARARFFQL